MQPVSLPPASPICLDLANECLRYEAQTISLRPKTFAVLRCLIEHADQLVSKTALLEAVWPATVVSDGVLMVCIRELRQALGDDPRTLQFIATAHRRGYRFIGQITRESASADAACLWLTPREGLPAPTHPPAPVRTSTYSRLPPLSGQRSH
jgi:DNA-binding winged helix-turn-helix (wHTH) protein